MDVKTIKIKARERLVPYCRVCKECDGRICAGEMPGLGGTGSGSSFQNNIKALAKHKLNLRTLHEVSEPDLKFSLFGMLLAAPVMAAPIAALGIQTDNKITDEEWTEAVVKGSQQAKTIAWTGDGPDPAFFEAGLNAISQNNYTGIPVIKPRENDAILERAEKAQKAGALAIAIDVDAAGIINMKLKGQPVGPKTKDDLEYITRNSSLPVIVKGIMTPNDAVLAAEAGVAGIVVSNHGGRVLDHTPGTAEVLSEISSEICGKIPVIVDGGIRSGEDVLKMLALGADAVLIGRPLLIGAAGGGAEGVFLVLSKIISELKIAMILTGCASLTAVSSEILR